MKKFVLLQILGFFTLAAAISIAAQDMGAAKENKGAPHNRKRTVFTSNTSEHSW